MIFGRNKNADDMEPPKAASPQTPVPPQPQAAPPAASAPANPAPPASANPTVAAESGAPGDQDQLARRALGAKMVAASFGEIVSILMRSDTYKHFSLADLEWLVLPPVLSRQFVLAEYRKDGNDVPAPVAVALWASVSQEVDQKLAANITGPLKLRPDEWKSGEILWLIDAVGPAQVLEGLIENLHKSVFKGRPLKVRARDKEGNPVIEIQKLPTATNEATPQA